MKVIKQVHAKGNNVRIIISLEYNCDNNEHYYYVKTKRLNDFSTRQINETEIVYSVESFTALSELMYHQFTNDSKIKNKVLLKELSNLSEFTVKIYENKANQIQ